MQLLLRWNTACSLWPDSQATALLFWGSVRPCSAANRLHLPIEEGGFNLSDIRSYHGVFWTVWTDKHLIRIPIEKGAITKPIFQHLFSFMYLKYVSPAFPLEDIKLQVSERKEEKCDLPTVMGARLELIRPENLLLLHSKLTQWASPWVRPLIREVWATSRIITLNLLFIPDNRVLESRNLQPQYYLTLKSRLQCN